jgi:hypothetical protein
VGFTSRTRVETLRDERLREELISTELPEIVDRAIALEQEREMRTRRDLRVYLGGLEHLDLRSRVLASHRIAAASAREYDALLSALQQRDAYLQTEPRTTDSVRTRGVFNVRLAGVVGLVATMALLQPLASLGVVPAAVALLVSIGLCGAGELFPTPEPGTAGSGRRLVVAMGRGTSTSRGRGGTGPRAMAQRHGRAERPAIGPRVP